MLFTTFTLYILQRFFVFYLHILTLLCHYCFAIFKEKKNIFPFLAFSLTSMIQVKLKQAEGMKVEFKKEKKNQLFQPVSVSENVTEWFFSPALIKTLQWQWSIWLRLAAADRWQQRDLIMLTARGFSQHYIALFYYPVWKKMNASKTMNQVAVVCK